MKKLAIYYRVSTDKQDFESQQSAIKAFLKDLPPHKSPESVMVFQDHGRSGKDGKREAYQALIRAAQAKEIDTIMVYRLDRLSRNATDAIQLILSLDQAGVGFISVTQPVLNLGLDNPFRRTMLAAFSEIAEIERDVIVARVNAGLESARKRGVKLGRPMAHDEDKKASVLELRAEGVSFREIARRLGIKKTSVERICKET